MAIEKPKAGPLAQLTDQDFFDFISNLGMPVFRTPLAAAFARHNWPLNTIKDYLDIHPTEASVVRLAKEFWKECLSA